MRDYILYIDEDREALSRFQREAAERLDARCTVAVADSAATGLLRLAELTAQSRTVSAVLVGCDGRADGDQAESAATSPSGYGPRPGAGALAAVHELLPDTGKILLCREPRDGAQRWALERSVQQLSQSFGLSQFFYKPWSAQQLFLTIEQLRRCARLSRKNERLLETLHQQRTELETLHSDLEGRIRERTQALEAANRRLAQLAVTDGLTGLFNQRYLKEHLVLEVERSLRTGVPLGVLMIDVDHFRRFNNRYGHQVGDDVLRRVARLIVEHRRVNDVVARYGGEEFALLLINAEKRVARSIAERLRARVAAEPFPLDRGGSGGALSISIGVASCPADGTTASGLLAAADAALFRAKHAGRNTVRVAGESERSRLFDGEPSRSGAPKTA